MSMQKRNVLSSPRLQELKKNKREQDYKMQEGETALANLKKLREAQSNFLI